MIAHANLQTEREGAQLELSNKRVQEVRRHFRGTLPMVAESTAQLQDQIRERDMVLSRHRSEHLALSEKCEELRRQADAEVAKIRAANATDHEAELIAEKDQLMVSKHGFAESIFLTGRQVILRCSTCKMNLRDTVLKQCMHSEWL